MSTLTDAPSTERADVSFERRLAWSVALVLIGANVYYFHRWAFRYNNAGTSPTYETTPFTWQAGKYVVLAVVAAAMWGWLLWRDRDRPPSWRIPYLPTARFAPTLAAMTAYLALVTLLAVRGAPHVRELVALFFFTPIVLAVPAAPFTPVSLTVYRTAGLVLIGYHAAFTAVQLGFYLVDDRLPALAYAGGLVRFGGGLDDPNGFGVLTVLPILLTITLWREFRQWWWAAGLLAVLGGMLFLTLSFSAAAALVAGLLALPPIMGRPKILFGVLAGIAGTTLLLLTSSYVRGVIDDKSRSAWGRLDFDGSDAQPGFADWLGDLTITRLLFGSPRDDVATEIGYVEFLVNFGVIAVVLLLVLLAIAFRRSLRTIRSARHGDRPTIARLYEGLTAYLVAFAVGSLGVPYFGVFPVNFVFWTAAMVAVLGPHLLAAEGAVGDRDRAVDTRARSAPDV